MSDAKKKKTAKKKKAGESELPSRPERIMRAVFRPSLLLPVAMIGAGIALFPALRTVLPDLSARPEYQLRTADIVIPDPPRWIPSDLASKVLRDAGLPEEVSVLQPDLVEKIHAAFVKHPWIQAPVEVRSSVPARIEVVFEYRQPVAMVEVSDGFYPVDDEGVLLPPGDFPPSELDRYPRIVGMRSPPVGGLGAAWGDARVIGAARLAVVLMPYWEEWKLKAIDVPTRQRADQKYEDLEFTVTTLGGSRIIWGRAPGNNHPLEVTDEKKVRRLKDFLAKGKTFDGNWEININHIVNEITRRQLTSSDRPR
jgi:hypothetical protein